MSENGWESSAPAWIADLGEHGDFGRRYVLDPVMLPRALALQPRTVLDVGCGEGRFCRQLAAHGIETTGIDPTRSLIAHARVRHPEGRYIDAKAEDIAFPDGAFDLVVSYLSLIDIPDVARAIAQMARVMKPGGALLIANLNSFNTACADQGWVKTALRELVHYPVDHYLDERSMWIEYRGIRIVNHHRPFSTYMKLLLAQDLQLAYFDEPPPRAGAPLPKAAHYRRLPWFHVMEWKKPAPTAPLA
ncbi:MAG: class I SAM-dependent methyltransferase [Hyphomonadaceae bacterium]